MLLSSLVVSLAFAAAPPRDIVGADRPRRTITTTAGPAESVCMTFSAFAVVVNDVADTKGTDGIEVRDRVGTVTEEALCAPDFAGPKRSLRMQSDLARGYFLGVKGPLVLLRGDDGFGAHDWLTVFRASSGALLLDTFRFNEQPLVLRQHGDFVSLQYLQGLKVGCDLRVKGEAHTACVKQIRADNRIADDVKLNFDVTRACRGVAKAAKLQLGVPAVIADGNAPVVRVLSGRVFCAEEP